MIGEKRKEGERLDKSPDPAHHLSRCGDDTPFGAAGSDRRCVVDCETNRLWGDRMTLAFSLSFRLTGKLPSSFFHTSLFLLFFFGVH